VPLADRDTSADTQDVKSFLGVREINGRLNGEAATMFLAYLGKDPCAPVNEWYPLVRISGRNFITYLF
jgi:hypothetical protein